MTTHRKPYDSDVGDAEWEFAAPDLTLLIEHDGQRRHDLDGCCGPAPPGG